MALRSHKGCVFDGQSSHVHFVPSFCAVRAFTRLRMHETVLKRTVYVN